MSQIQSAPTFEDIFSEEIHDIISRPPHWLIQCGTSIFLILTIVLFTCSWVIQYPDVVNAPFTLSAKNPPRTVVLRNEGKLAKLLIEDGAMVKSGDLLAYSESTAATEQVLALEKRLQSWSSVVSKGRWQHFEQLPFQKFTDLGEIQTEYESFTIKLDELRSFLSGGFYLQKRQLLLKDVLALKQLENNLIEQLDLQERDYQLSKEEFETQDLLFKQKVIALSEFKREKAKLIVKEFPLKGLSAQLIQNKSSQTEKEKEVLELDNSIVKQKNSFLQTLQSLQSNIAAWKQRYVITAPISGKVSFTAPWSEQQHLTMGQELLTIEPATGTLEGLVKIPQANLGKIEIGQKVLIKLDGYPYKEFGMLVGELSKVSVTPGQDSLFWGFVSLPNQLETKYHLKLNYRSGMRGTAEIVTADRRLAERLLSAFSEGK